MSRWIYLAPIVAALLSFLYARYVPTVQSPAHMSAVAPTAALASDGKPAVAAEDHSVLMDQIVLFGDSITQGAWVPAGTGSTMSIAYQRKLDVMNRGLSAAWGLPVIKQWLPRRGERLPKIRLLFIWFGANDAALPSSPQHVTLEEFKTNLVSIVDLVRSPASPYYSPGTVPVLVTPPPVNAHVRNAELTSRDPPRVPDRDAALTQAYADAVRLVAAQERLHVVDVWTAIDTKAREDGGLEKYLYDGLHLSAAGYEIVTGEIANLIVNELPELHWDRLPQVFPHWEDCIPEAQRF
ncbi:hypothetical protein JCM11491_002828 [Sporobolomyces phaffii]